MNWRDANWTIFCTSWQNMRRKILFNVHLQVELVVWKKTWLMISSCGWRIFSFVVLIFSRILASCHVNSETNPCAILKNTNCSIAKTVASNSSLVPLSSTICWHSAMSKKHCSMLSARTLHSAQNLGSIWQTIPRMDNCMLYNFPFDWSTWGGKNIFATIKMAFW